jgi:RNA polymerase sigma-70 factor (ECF subfamily)
MILVLSLGLLIECRFFSRILGTIYTRRGIELTEHVLANPHRRSDEELLESSGRGDQGAFAELYRRHAGNVYGFLLRRGLTTTEADDLCQEIFMGLLKAAPRFEPRAKVKTFLYRIAFNQLAKATRRRKPTLESRDSVPDGRRDPEEATAMTEMAKRVRTAMNTLTEEQRDALLLNHFQGMSYREVAETLDVPIGTVRSRLARAKLALREALNDLLEGEGQGESS